MVDLPAPWRPSPQSQQPIDIIPKYRPSLVHVDGFLQLTDILFCALLLLKLHMHGLHRELKYSIIFRYSFNIIINIPTSTPAI